MVETAIEAAAAYFVGREAVKRFAKDANQQPLPETDLKRTAIAIAGAAAAIWAYRKFVKKSA